MTRKLNGIYVDSDGNISCRKGDSGSVAVTGIPKDDDYKVSLGIVNPENHQIIQEVSVQSDNESGVEIPISVSFTESVGVGRFFYGIKLTDSDGEEQTVLPKAYEDSNGYLAIGSPKTFTVKPMLARGGE